MDPFNTLGSLYNTASSYASQGAKAVEAVGEKVYETASTTAAKVSDTGQRVSDKASQFASEKASALGTAVSSYLPSLPSTPQVQQVAKESPVDTQRASSLGSVVSDSLNETWNALPPEAQQGLTLAGQTASSTVSEVKEEVRDKLAKVGGEKIIDLAPVALDKAQPYIKPVLEKAEPLIDDAISTVASSKLGREILERAAKDTISVTPVVGGLVSGYGAYEDLTNSADSFQKGQIVSGTLYGVSGAINTAEVLAAGAEALEAGAGIATSETVVGAAAGGVAVVGTTAIDAGLNVLSFGAGVSADVAKSYGY
ncbi:MAG: hypothetical protein ACK4IX_01845 [Candidatus Sericytochromatia bacterium]